MCTDVLIDPFFPLKVLEKLSPKKFQNTTCVFFSLSTTDIGEALAEILMASYSLYLHKVLLSFFDKNS